MVVKQIGRRIEGAQGAVEVQRVVRKRHGEPLAGYYLHAVAGQNIVAHPAHMAFVALFASFVYRIMGFAAERKRDGAALAQLNAQFFQAVACTLVALRLAGIGVDNQVDFAAEIVDNRQFLRQHQENIGGTERVFFRGVFQTVGEVLEMVDGFVAEIAD